MSPTDLPPWPGSPPTHGRVHLRPGRRDDVAMARELSTDPYVPLVGTLPPRADETEALAWIARQQGRYREGAGFSFTVVETANDRPVGHCGLWFRDLAAGTSTVGYSIVPSARGRGHAADAISALAQLAWTVPALHRVEAHVEPWNVASVRAAERAGYVSEGVIHGGRVIAGTPRDVLLLAARRPNH